MSFDLGVWHSDLAISDKEAQSIYRRLCKDPHFLKGESASVEAFYIELTAHWPEIDTVSEDKLDDSDYCPWSCALDKSGMHVIMPCVWSKAEDVATFVYDLVRLHACIKVKFVNQPRRSPRFTHLRSIELTHTENALAHGQELGGAISSTPQARKPLVARSQLARRRHPRRLPRGKNAQNPSRAPHLVGHFSRAYPGNFSRVPT